MDIKRNSDSTSQDWPYIRQDLPSRIKDLCTEKGHVPAISLDLRQFQNPPISEGGQESWSSTLSKARITIVDMYESGMFALVHASL